MCLNVYSAPTYLPNTLLQHSLHISHVYEEVKKIKNLPIYINVNTQYTQLFT